LLNDAYIESKLLHNAKKLSWYSSIKFVLDKVSSLLNVDSSKINGERLKDFFVKDWQKRLKENSSGKLCSYYLFKNNFRCENYLSLIKKNLNTEGACQDFVYQLTNYISKLVDIWAFSGTIEYAHGASLMRLKMSNIISLLVLAWNQKGKYYMIPLKKVVLILNILTIRTNLYGY
jgi:hypothetical protein